MVGLKPKALLKCECGQIVAHGSVFCVSCRDEILKKNARMIEKEEKIYQIKMRGKAKSGKTKRSAVLVASS